MIDAGHRPSEAPARQVREALAADEPALLALFRRAFGHDMAPALWRWKYQNPRSHGTLVEFAGDVVAYYGGVPRTVRCFGNPVTAVQIGDVMVTPALRGKLTRHGPFFEAATGFITRWMDTHREYDFAFGFPSERASRLGVALNLYQPMDRILEVQWPAQGAGHGLLVSARPLTVSDHQAVNRLWQRMAKDLSGGVVGVRDFDFLRHRYLQHPVQRYHVLLVSRRLTGHPLGVVVLRDHGAHGLELLDLVAPRRQMPALVNVARRIAERGGQQRVFAWATPMAVKSIAGKAGQAQATEVVVPAIVWRQPETVQRLKDRWWLMGGDADFR